MKTGYIIREYALIFGIIFRFLTFFVRICIDIKYNLIYNYNIIR